MRGYCSNSPLRCSNARSAVVLNQIDLCCPECGLFLLPVQRISNRTGTTQRVLQWALVVMVLLLLALVYIYYANFV